VIGRSRQSYSAVTGAPGSAIADAEAALADGKVVATFLAIAYAHAADVAFEHAAAGFGSVRRMLA